VTSRYSADAVGNSNAAVSGDSAIGVGFTLGLCKFYERLSCPAHTAQSWIATLNHFFRNFSRFRRGRTFAFLAHEIPSINFSQLISRRPGFVSSPAGVW
jgi:hypothetical protein